MRKNLMVRSRRLGRWEIEQEVQGSEWEIVDKNTYKMHRIDETEECFGRTHLRSEEGGPDSFTGEGDEYIP
jgi:hypothetical protein